MVLSSQSNLQTYRRFAMARTHILFTAIVLSLLLVTPANSQNKSSDIDVVTVYATKSERNTFDIPGMVSVIDARDPALIGSSTIAELIDTTIGLESSGSARRNGQNFTMRGYGGKGIIILIDGIRQRFESAHDGKFFIDPAIVKRAEVVRGPNSSLYGTGGLGGIVAFETVSVKDLLDEGQSAGALISSNYKSVNNEKMLSATAYQNSGLFNLLGQFNYRDSSDIELSKSTNGVSDLPADMEAINGLIKLSYGDKEIGRYTITLLNNENDSLENDSPDGYLDRSGNVEAANVDKLIESSSLRLGYELNSLNILTYYTDVEINEKILSGLSTGREKQRQHTNFGLNIDNQHIFTIGDLNHVFTYGFEFFSEELKSSDSQPNSGFPFFLNYQNSIPNAEAETVSIFVQDEITIGKSGASGTTYIVAGIRHDMYESSHTISGRSQDETATSYRLGASYAATQNLKIFSNFAQAFRAPDLGEIYAEGSHFPGSNFVPNYELKPEENETIEFGLGYEADGLFNAEDSLSIKATVFDTEGKDFIFRCVYYPSVPNFSSCPDGGLPSYPNYNALFRPSFGPAGALPPFMNPTFTDNLASVTIEGNELEARYRNNNLYLKLARSEVDAKNDITGKLLNTTQPVMYKGQVDYDFKSYNASIGWSFTIAEDKKMTSDADQGDESYMVNNLYAGWQVTDKLGLSVKITNALDEEYTRPTSVVPAPARGFVLNLKYKY